MATVVKSFAIQGVDGYTVDIESKVLDGQPMISIIGMGDVAVKEAGDRIQSAIDESGYVFPKKRVIISLAPGDKKKRGSHFDLAMAIGVLQEGENIAAKELNQYGFIGELSLDGSLRACCGILPMILAAKKNGIKKVIIPQANIGEAKLVHGIETLGFTDLTEVIRYLEGKQAFLEKPEIIAEDSLFAERTLDFSDVKGQEDVIEAALLAAAGGHNMLMIGEPGCGKTMIAQRISTILPEMSEEECLEVTKIYSISGLLSNGHSLVKNRPFRAPHHNASLNALIGGGVNAMPGEVSLAHNGVLFLDELAEFSRKTLDALRQPVEDKKVSVARVNGAHTYPANFMFVTAMNPCPCGYYPDMNRCRCTPAQVGQYLGKLSQPLLDRLDLCADVSPVDFDGMSNGKIGENTKQIRMRVEAAQQIQKERFKDEKIQFNGEMSGKQVEKFCHLDDSAGRLLKMAFQHMPFSVRAYHRILKVARTIADMEASENINKEHLGEALSYRSFDKKYWN